MTRVPHFDLPFRFGVTAGQLGVAAIAVEQDTQDDVTNCVEIVLRYPRGFRSDVPEFGIQDQTLTQQPIALDDMAAAITRWEPRAITRLTQAPDRLDDLIVRVLSEVAVRRTP
jgi:phage baseplate assembly protein W